MPRIVIACVLLQFVDSVKSVPPLQTQTLRVNNGNTDAQQLTLQASDAAQQPASGETSARQPATPSLPSPQSDGQQRHRSPSPLTAGTSNEGSSTQPAITQVADSAAVADGAIADKDGGCCDCASGGSCGRAA